MSVEPSSFSKPVLDRVLRDEANFANEDYAPFAGDLSISEKMYRKYREPSEWWDWRQMAALLLGNIKDKDLLDFGCGMGEESIYFASLGARVTGIDISEVGVATLKKRAAFHNLKNVTAIEMRADPTSFPAASFDRIHGLGILHHIGIEAGLKEVARLLRPGGIGVFLEPLGDDPKVEAVKNWMMKHGRFLADFDDVTDHEHNLTWKEIEDATARFDKTTLYPYHLFYRLKRFFPYPILDVIRRIDAGILDLLPMMKRYAGGVVIAVHAASK